jgi:hypothetical protein
MEDLKSKAASLPPPPGIIGSLTTGFDAVAGHIATILVPLGLDVFLWLGPRIRADQYYAGLQNSLLNSWPEPGPTAEQSIQAQELYTKFLEWLQTFNLFSNLRTFPIGIFSLIAGKAIEMTPLGLPPVIQIGSAPTLFGSTILLTVLGWIGGGLYFRWVASVVADKSRFAPGRTVLQAILYSVVWSLLAAVIGLPVFLFVYVLFLANPGLGQAVLLLLGFLSMWLIVPLFFSLHGIFLKRQNALISVLESLQMTRFTLPTSSLFVLSILVISTGMNLLWSIPPDDSWMALIGILGHAFVTTALLASSFVYYRDMTAWLRTVLERLRAGMPTQPV